MPMTAKKQRQDWAQRHPTVWMGLNILACVIVLVIGWFTIREQIPIFITGSVMSRSSPPLKKVLSGLATHCVTSLYIDDTYLLTSGGFSFYVKHNPRLQGAYVYLSQGQWRVAHAYCRHDDCENQLSLAAMPVFNLNTLTPVLQRFLTHVEQTEQTMSIFYHHNGTFSCGDYQQEQEQIAINEEIE